jgi:apolipoprotein N-acyltransferase
MRSRRGIRFILGRLNAPNYSATRPHNSSAPIALIVLIWAAISVATVAGIAWFSTSVFLLLDDPAVAIGVALFGVPAALAITAMLGR